MPDPGLPPIDPDVDLHVQAERDELTPSPWPVLAAISTGGVLGALARYGLQSAFPQAPTAFPWATFGVNVTGCLLIGVLMTLITELWPHKLLLRPFLGVGVLGGFTTFSTYVVDIRQAVSTGAGEIALAGLAGTLITAMLAVWLGVAVTGRVLRAAGIGCSR
jgi:fluoride exporter